MIRIIRIMILEFFPMILMISNDNLESPLEGWTVKWGCFMGTMMQLFSEIYKSMGCFMWIEWPTVHEAVTPAILQGCTGDRMGDRSRYRINNVT